MSCGILADAVLGSAPRTWSAFCSHCSTAEATAPPEEQARRAAFVEANWPTEQAETPPLSFHGERAGTSVELPLVSVAARLGERVLLNALLRLDHSPGRHLECLRQEVADAAAPSLERVLRSPELRLEDCELGALFVEAAATPRANSCVDVLLALVEGDGGVLWSLCDEPRFHEPRWWPFTVFELAIVTAAEHGNEDTFQTLLTRGDDHMSPSQQRRVLFRLVDSAAERPLIALLHRLPHLIRLMDELRFEPSSAAEKLRRRALFQLWFESPTRPCGNARSFAHPLLTLNS